MTIREKYNCGNCDFWEFAQELVPVQSSTIKFADGAKPLQVRAGRCRKDPPQMVVIPVQSRMGQMEVKQERVFPLQTENDFCSHHPMLRADTLRGLVASCFHVWDNRVAYKPGEVADSIAAGFTRKPTLAEAKAIAFGADAKAGEPVPEPKT